MTAPMSQEATTATTPATPVAASPVPAPPGRQYFRVVVVPLGWCAGVLVATIGRPLRALLIVGLLAVIVTSAWFTGRQLWAQYHLRAAREAVAHYHSLDATTHLQVCLAQWPDHPESLLLA